MADIHPLRCKSQDPSGEDFIRKNKEASERCKLMLKEGQAPMPRMSHLSSRDYQNVYEPSDDTFLLMDALYLDYKKDADDESNHDLISLEVGCGTGVATILLGQILRETGQTNNRFFHFLTDINDDALRIALATAKENSIPDEDIKSYNCDLASAFLEDSTALNLPSTCPSLRRNVDILIFNPPYVPTPDDEVGSNGIQASWAGGKDGRVVVDRFLPQIPELLKENGVCYMITVDDNYPEDIAKRMLTSFNIVMEPYLRRKAHNEYLTVQKMSRIRSNQCSKYSKAL